MAMQNRNKKRYIYFISLVITSCIIFNLTSMSVSGQGFSLQLISKSAGIDKNVIDEKLLQMMKEIKLPGDMRNSKQNALSGSSKEKVKNDKTANDKTTNSNNKLSKESQSYSDEEEYNIRGDPATMENRKFPHVPYDIQNTKDLDFRIYSHNVKNGGHEYLVEGELKWADRYKLIASSISFHAMPNTIVTLQEVYDFQLKDILQELNRYSDSENPEWHAYGVGRIDAKKVGEFVPILYRSSEWNLIFNDTIWLNENNQRIAYEGWDALYLRIASYVTLQSKVSGSHVNIFNTHLDHIGDISRLESVRLLSRRMEDINSWPSFLCGDLNFEPKEDSYKALSEYYVDSSKLATDDNSYGHTKSTVTGFEGEVLLKGGQNIDYIFCPEYTLKMDSGSCEANGRLINPFLKLKRRGMLHSKFDGIYMSDHRPLVADFILSTKC